MQAASPSPSDKQSWRQEFRRRLRQHPDPVAESAAIRQHLAAELPPSPGLVIATFAALPGEADLLPLLEEITEVVWCFPRVVGDDLCFHHVADPSELRPGAMSILEPDDSAPIIGAGNFDIVLCPGLGFGRDGSRLGRGRGYYDRTLETCAESTRIIGIALSHQIEDTVPTEPHDHLMSQLACPQGILNF